MSGFNWNNAISLNENVHSKFDRQRRLPLWSSLKYDLNVLLRCNFRTLRVIAGLSAAEKLVPLLDHEGGCYRYKGGDRKEELSDGKVCSLNWRRGGCRCVKDFYVAYTSWANNSFTFINFTAIGLRFIHYKVGGSDGIVGVNDHFIVIQSLPFLAEHLSGLKKY